MKDSVPYDFLFLILLAIISVSAIIIRYAEPLSDGDIWFHLAYGRYFVANHTLTLDHTIFSWTPAHNNTIYCSWIPEIIFYLLFQAGGLSMLYALRYLFIIVFLVLALSFFNKDQARYLPGAFLICLIGLLMSYAGLRIKAELFSFLFMTVMVWTWLRIKKEPDTALPFIYLIPFIILLWVNSHGGFIFGVLFLVLVCIGEALNWVLRSPELLNLRYKKHLFLSMALSGLSLLMTPYGWRYPAQLVNNLVINPEEFKRHIATIDEYKSIFVPQSFYLHYIDYMVISSIILAILITYQIRRHRIDWALILVNICFMILYTRYLRATHYEAIIFAFTSLYIIGHVSPYPKIKFQGILVQCITFILLLFFAVRTQYDTFCTPGTGFNLLYSSPEQESNYIRQHFKHLNLGNDYSCGSYFLWSLWPSNKVFIDARYFPYSAWYSEGYELLKSQDKTRIEFLLNKYKCDVWCVSYDSPLLQYLMSSPEWRLVYYGPSACILSSQKYTFPSNPHPFSDSISSANIYNAYNIVKFASSIGDIEESKKIVMNMKPFPLCPQQINLAANACLNVGGKLLTRERYYDAIEVFSNALNMTQDHLLPDAFLGDEFTAYVAMMHDGLGYSFMKVNRIGDAAREYRDSLKLNPNIKNANKYLPLLSTQMVKVNGRISELKLSLNRNPKDLNIINSLLACYSINGQYDQALDYLKREINISPDNPAIYYNIACIYARQNKVEDSVNYLEKAISKGFNDWNLLIKDHDLDNVRNTSYYIELMRVH